ncbi:DUF2336 domain-containing protein [Aurantimonas coralicida]|uniref:DUF2336 domain-containing protein n=1 Tax=Aurantimonas coralicida TaxID=182270 RepID=UPI002384A9AE|nr:DUF2336 domain-containing protein [Aurantimonas coralicida]MDE0923679.1 DUF2336 domain-containing protein [Aurantimonas coralicida]
MIVQRFVKWCETATSTQRAEGAAILSRALLDGRITAEERPGADAALMLMLDDPSPKVRQAMALELADGRGAPRAVLRALCEDNDSIACIVAGRSPALSDDDLIDLVATGSEALRGAIAARRLVSARVAAALAELAASDTCITLLGNPGAGIASISYRRISERHGDVAALRGALMAREDLPSTVRQTLILRTGQALAELPMLRNLVGGDRADRLAFEACERATALLADNIGEAEVPALVEHLRASGQLNVAFLLRTVCTGNIDLFAAALVRLSAMSDRRVRTILADGRQSAFRTLMTAAGLPVASAPLFRCAVSVWRELATGRLSVAVEDVPQLVMQRVAGSFPTTQGDSGFDEIMRFLHRLAGETSREAARQHARQLAA